MSDITDGADNRSLYEKTFGKRSLLSCLIGHFFADKNNAASLVALFVVGTLCYIVAVKGQYEYVTGLLNIGFVVVGYYFGSKRDKEKDEDDQPAPAAYYPDEGTEPTP